MLKIKYNLPEKAGNWTTLKIITKPIKDYSPQTYKIPVRILEELKNEDI